MRRQAGTTPLVGQILFAEHGDGTIVLDCVLSRAGTDAAWVPVTLEVRLPRRSAAETALEVLDGWAKRAAAVEVRIAESLRGPEVEITSGTTRLLLEPEQ